MRIFVQHHPSIKTQKHHKQEQKNVETARSPHTYLHTLLLGTVSYSPYHIKKRSSRPRHKNNITEHEQQQQPQHRSSVISSDGETMGMPKRKLSRPPYPRVGTQLRPGATPSSWRIGDNISNTVLSSSGINSSATASTSDGNEEYKASVCSSSSSSCHNGRVACGRTYTFDPQRSIDHGINHTIGQDIGAGGSGGGGGGGGGDVGGGGGGSSGGGGGGSSGGGGGGGRGYGGGGGGKIGGGGGGGVGGGDMFLACPTSSSNIDIMGSDNTFEVEPADRSQSSPVDPDLGLGESELLALGNLLLQRLASAERPQAVVFEEEEEDEEEEEEEKGQEGSNFGGMPPWVPFSSQPFSLSGGMLVTEDDGAGSDEEDGDEGWEGGVDAAKEIIFELFKEGYDEQETLITEHAVQGAPTEYETQQALEKLEKKQGKGTRTLKKAVAYIMDPLNTAEKEGEHSKEHENRLRVELDAEKEQHAQVREALSTRAADISQHLERTKHSQAQLTTENKRLFAANERLEETHRGLQEKVARLTKTLADFIMTTSTDPESDVIEAVKGSLGASPPTSSGAFVGPAAGPAEGPSSFSAATAAEGKETSSTGAKAMAAGAVGVGAPAATFSGRFSFGPGVSPAKGPSSSSANTASKGEAACPPLVVTPFSARAEVAPVSAPFAAVAPVGKMAVSPSVVSVVAETVVAGVVDPGASTSTSSACSVGLAVSLAEEDSSSSLADTAAKGATAPSLLGVVTPCRPRVEVARPSSVFAATFSVEKFEPAKYDIVEAAVGEAGTNVSTATSSGGFFGSAVNWASSSPATAAAPAAAAAAAAKGKTAPSLQTVTPPPPGVEVPRPGPRFSTTFSVGEMAASSLTSFRSKQQTALKSKVRKPAAGHAVKGKTVPSLQTMTPPPPPGVEVPRPSPRFSTTFSVGGMTASSPTSSRSKQQTAAKGKVGKQTAGEEAEFPALDLKSPLVEEEEPNQFCRTSRRHTHRPLTPVTSNPGGRRRAAGAERPAFSVRAAANPCQRRSSAGGEVPSLASRGVAKKPARKPSVNRSSTGREVLPLSSRVEPRPALRPDLKRGSTGKEVVAARVAAAGSAKKNESVGKGSAVEASESVGKGPAVEVGRGGGGARTGGLVRGKGSGDGGGKMGVASSGRVLRSASRAAAAAVEASTGAGISAASGTAPAAAATAIAAIAAATAQVQPTRSGRSATHRPTQRTKAKGRDISTRGKFMSF